MTYVILHRQKTFNLSNQHILQHFTEISKPRRVSNSNNISYIYIFFLCRG